MVGSKASLSSTPHRHSPDDHSIHTDGFRLLSPREEQVLQLAAHGHLDKEISAELGVSLNTLRTYWTRIRAKVGDAPRIALATAFVENRTAHAPPPLLTSETADWEVDFARNMAVYHTPDPNEPEIPAGTERTLGNVFESFHPEDAPAMRSALQAIHEGSLSSFAYTARRVTSRGVVTVSAFVQVTRDARGKAVKLYGKRMTPIDARASASEVAVGLWSRDLRTGELWLDDGFKKIYRLTGDEPDLRAAILERNHPEDRPLGANYVEEMIASGVTNLRRTFRIRDEDGSYRWASADIRLESDAEGPTRTRGTILVYPR